MSRSQDGVRLRSGAGYFGLVEEKKALAIHTSGVYAPGLPPAFGSDFSNPFFIYWLNFVGITDNTHVRMAPSATNTDPDGARRAAEAELRELAGTFAVHLSAGKARAGDLQLAGGQAW